MNLVQSNDIEIADPVKYVKFINRLVKIVTYKNSIHIGYVYTIDPVSNAIVVMSYNDLILNKVIIIPGTSVNTIEILDDIINEHVVSKHNKLYNKDNEYDDQKTQENLEKTLEKLKFNRIDYVYEAEENIIKVGNALKIESPFTMEYCYSDNPIVLDTIKSILN